MKFIARPILLFFLCLSIGCKADAQDKKSTSSKSINTNITLHTSDSIWKAQIISRLNDIIFNYYNDETFFTLWDNGVLKRWVAPCLEVAFITNRYIYSAKYAPSLLSIQTVGADKLKVKVAFLFEGMEKQEPEIFAIYNFILNIKNDKLFFSPYVEYHTQSWTTNRIDSINFKYKPAHQFNPKLALKTSKFNNELASFFDIQPLGFDYYINENAEELNRALGFDLNPYMYAMNQYSGITQAINKKVFSGNGLEWFPHEIVHLYTYQKFNKNATKIHSIFDEGIATWLGGSIDKELKWHVQTLKNHSKLKKINLNNFAAANITITDSTNLHYTIGGVLCEQAYTMFGKQILWELVDNSNSEELVYQNICKVFGVKREDVGKLILELLEKY